MKSTVKSVLCCLVLAVSTAAGADEVKSVEFGAATVFYDYRPAREGVATLSLNAVITETNNSLRGLRNSDPRRLGKLGQLIYQCKLLLYTPQNTAREPEAETPMLVSRNYSLFTDVNLSLPAGERLGIRVISSQPVDTASLFTASLGGGEIRREVWEDVGDGSPVDLRQVNVNALIENDMIGNAESIDIVLRFPIFQLQKPVRQWSYNFGLADFRQAVRHADEYCTPKSLRELIDRNG
jgi:hypothetical protein